MIKDATEPVNHSRMGLAIVGGVALSGLALLLVAQAGGAQGWLFNVFLLAAAAALGLYVRIIYRGQQHLWQRVDGAERRNGDVEKTLVQALERLRAGDLVSCAERSRELPGKLATTFANATNALDVLAQQIQASSVEVAAAANSVNEIASELASGSSQQAASVVEITAAMEELARTASQIADNAATQADLAQKAEESGNLGKVAVEEAVGGVEEVRKRI